MKTPPAMTLKDIATLAGTTKSTVSRVVSGDPRISMATRQRVQRFIQQHGYRPLVLAQALASGRTGAIGVLSGNIGSGFFAEVIRGIDLAAGRSKGHLHISIAHGDEDYFRLLEGLAASRQVDGIVLIDPPLQLFARTRPNPPLPFVLCACRAPRQAPVWKRVDDVTADNAGPMERLVTHLLEQGITDIVHLAGPVNTYDGRQRRRAFELAARRLKVPRWRVLPNHLIQDDGQAVMQTIFRQSRRWPGAFVAFNDSVALGVLAEIRRQRTPRCPAITGWDNSPAAEMLGLTSVEMPLTALGETAAGLLTARMQATADPARPAQHIRLEAVVHIRASTAAPVCSSRKDPP